MKKDYMILDLKSCFMQQPRNITCGIEIEVYLKHGDGRLVGDVAITDKLLEKLPKTITKDYYPYQLEIRTEPHKTANGMIAELKKSIKQCYEEAKKLGLTLQFASWLGGNEMFNGLHFHTRTGKNNKFMNNIINVYPLVLSLASYFRCSPAGFNYLTRRIDNSPHCGLPHLDQHDLISSDNRNRYKDIVINMFKDNNRTRLKSVNTLEMRIFDVPCDWNYLVLLIRLLYKIQEHIIVEEAFYKISDKGARNKYYDTARDSRDEICACKHTKNYFFNEYNDEIINNLCKLFGLEPLDENLLEFLDNEPIEHSLHKGFSFLKAITTKVNKEKKNDKEEVSNNPNELPNVLSDMTSSRIFSSPEIERIFNHGVSSREDGITFHGDELTEQTESEIGEEVEVPSLDGMVPMDPFGLSDAEQRTNLRLLERHAREIEAMTTAQTDIPYEQPLTHDLNEQPRRGFVRDDQTHGTDITRRRNMRTE